ncbi:hypothetical protein LB503_003214 [Fusarium chuoi]|nr:hypothetical protein LB503_003214 [Fusarium chuoi]
MTDIKDIRSHNNHLEYSPAARCDAILVADLPQWIIASSSTMLLALQHIPDHKMVCPQLYRRTP